MLKNLIMSILLGLCMLVSATCNAQEVAETEAIDYDLEQQVEPSELDVCLWLAQHGYWEGLLVELSLIAHDTMKEVIKWKSN